MRARVARPQSSIILEYMATTCNTNVFALRMEAKRFPPPKGPTIKHGGLRPTTRQCAVVHGEKRGRRHQRANCG